MKVAANINALLQKHNFVKGVVEYSAEISVLGVKVVVPVNEEFVQRLDTLAESSNKPPETSRLQEIRRKAKTRNPSPQDFDYSIADVDDDEYQPNDDFEQA